MNLTVIEQFAEHVVGEVISDAERIAEILASDWAMFVNKTEPASEPASIEAAPTPSEEL